MAFCKQGAATGTLAAWAYDATWLIARGIKAAAALCPANQMPTGSNIMQQLRLVSFSGARLAFACIAADAGRLAGATGTISFPASGQLRNDRLHASGYQVLNVRGVSFATVKLSVAIQFQRSDSDPGC